MNDHELIEELTSARALGGLDAEDAAVLEAQMASHGPECLECRRLSDEADEVAGRLAFALDPVPVPDGFEDRVVAAAGIGERVPLRRAQPRELQRARSRRTPPGVRLRPLVAIAASLVLFAGGWLASGLLSGDEAGVPSGARVVAFQGEGGADLSVAYTPGEPGLYLLGSGLEAPPEGMVYEVWMIQGGTPIPGTCFAPAEDGSLFTFVDAELGSTDTMAVTIEPATCSDQPTSDPILTAPITA